MHEHSILFSAALESLRHGIAHYLLGGSEDRGPAILELHRAMELVFKRKSEILEIDWTKRDLWPIPNLVGELKGRGVQIHIGWSNLNALRNDVKHRGYTPSCGDFQSLVRSDAFPLLRDFLTRELQCDLEDVLPTDYCEVLKGEDKWDITARVFAMAAAEYLIRDLAEAVRLAKRGLEEAVQGLAEENREALENAALERAKEGDYIPPFEKWRFGDLLEAFLWPVGDCPEDYVPYSGFILPDDVERIKESIIPRELRELPPRYVAYRFVTTACDWAFRFAAALQLTPRSDTTGEIRMRWERIVDALREETPDVYAMVRQIDPESIEVRGNTLWITAYETEQQEALNEMMHKHKQDIARAIHNRGDIPDHVVLDIRIGNPLDETVGPPFYMYMSDRHAQTDQWDEW